MLDKTAINWMAVCFVLALLLLLGGYFVFYAQNSNKNYQLQHSYKIKNNLWLYITEDREGNATVPITNRFYITDKISGGEDFIANKLKYQIPFLTGSGTISQVKVSDNYNIAITYSGKVSSLSDSISYSLNGQQVNAHLSYQIN
ncbi:hypothetical protein [Rosenbergiella epipactidis]|uniref:hypothetical protein n=1 Tax=Rosenbergiella epipactidis TaxID=1544694 RepID=UPI001F4E621E|nr:hypothetical protein [Rosenbergiella epipactidis]